ncbi:hypothetical protein F5Y17DRAFT_463903 [Xylariaceae sp. FL0594]|nr:hypothetical protein F5Y17DRAFT_463903 [Xylariaceae sp. FL0594]
MPPRNKSTGVTKALGRQMNKQATRSLAQSMADQRQEISQLKARLSELQEKSKTGDPDAQKEADALQKSIDEMEVDTDDDGPTSPRSALFVPLQTGECNGRPMSRVRIMMARASGWDFIRDLGVSSLF